MFTDMVGYTALMQEDEPKTRELRDHFREVVRRFVDERSGRILQFYGDGALSSFRSAIEATRSALEIQRALREDPKIPVRIGIHVGDVVFEEEEVYGDSVNVASRVERLAAPGGICVSERVYDDIKNQAGIDAISLGRVKLKNVRRPIEIFALTGEELAVPEAAEFIGEESPKVTPALDKYRIAVLPLANYSPDPTDEYFADGMTEELISRLSRIGGLRVIARTSVMQYKRSEKSIAEIGRQLKVGTVLEGSVRKAGNKLRITEQLIDVETQEHLWSEHYDREFKDVFAIQSDIAQRVGEALKVQLLSREKQQMQKKSTEDLEAYKLYLNGRYYWNKRTGEGLENGIEYFEQAIEKDPSFALAYAGLADSYILLAGYTYMPPTEALPRAKKAARKALELDETLAEAHTSLAGTTFHYYDWLTTESELKRAIELNPSYATAHHWYAVVLAALGRLDEAIAREKEALELDPFDLVINTYMGWINYFARQFDQALEQYRHTLKLNPKFHLAHLWLGQAYVQEGMYEAAIAAIQEAITLSGDSTLARAALGHAYAVSDRRKDAQEVLNELNELSKQRYVPSYYIAAIYAGLGDKDLAFEWLEKAYEEHYLFLNWLKVEPIFDSLRSDPRLIELLKKMGLEE